jgi:hypothetical protein
VRMWAVLVQMWSPSAPCSAACAPEDDKALGQSRGASDERLVPNGACLGSVRVLVPQVP